MNTVEIENANDSLRDYANRLEGNPLVLTVAGRPVAALLPLENTDMEMASLSTNPEFLKLIERSRKRQETEGGISSKKMREILGIKR